jgi:L-fuconolactonase
MFRVGRIGARAVSVSLGAISQAVRMSVARRARQAAVSPSERAGLRPARRRYELSGPRRKPGEATKMTRQPTTELSRRGLMGVAAAAVAAGACGPALAAAAPARGIIDTHLHLFDPKRPQGAPYKGPKGSIFNTEGASPEMYEKIMRPLGVTGAIAVDASPWPEDNLWVLETIARSPMMVGFVGNLKPEAPDFAATLERYAKNPLFRGIRYGNLWGYDIVARSTDPAFIDGLKRLAGADLVLDTANPKISLLSAIVRVNDAVPELRIVIDHLPHLDPTTEERPEYDRLLREIHGRPSIAVKISEVLHPVNGVVSRNLADHRAKLDHIYESFGEDRVVFGSDWPNIEGDAPVAEEFRIVEAYFASKTQAQRDKYFFANSRRVYKWVARTPAQQRLA